MCLFRFLTQPKEAPCSLLVRSGSCVCGVCVVEHPLVEKAIITKMYKRVVCSMSSAISTTTKATMMAGSASVLALAIYRLSKVSCLWWVCVFAEGGFRVCGVCE